MAKYRVRFNDKARAGAVSRRNDLKRKRQKQFDNEDEPDPVAEEPRDPNAQVLLPVTDQQKQERKRSLREAITPQTKIKNAKKKRLEKYIDRQVRRQERDEIFAKLAQSTVTTTNYQSLKLLGQGKRIDKEIDAVDEESDDERSDGSSSDSEAEAPSQFIDHRQFSQGFGFLDLPKVKPAPKKAVSWRETLGFDQESEVESASSGSESGSGMDSDSESHSNSSSDISHGSSSPAVSEEESDAGTPGDGTTAGKEFKRWAKMLQEHTSVPTPTVDNYNHVQRTEEQEPVPEVTKTVARGATYYVSVQRSQEIEDVRINLPAVACEQQIMDAIFHNDCIVITGETGSGKTTQVPQFLYEAGYGARDSDTPGLIGVTQPRRVAAVSMAARVATELGDHGSKVGYQIRFDGKTTPDTRIKFMTDGVLLREMASDLMLTKYSAIVVDEAHERSVNTDILLGLLSRVVRLRREEREPLKLVIMSATLRVGDFTENTALFSLPPPVVSVEARQFPVAVHFSRRTTHDYVDDAVQKAIKIHEKLPKGGILIFLTGQNEISHAINQLQRYANGGKTQRVAQVRITAKDVVMEEESIELNVSEDDFEEEFEDDTEEDEGFDEEYDGEETKLLVLPLYSLLPTKDQMKVFDRLPANTRLCVVATNVAETSLTIPNIKYVVDSGRVKQRLYDQETGVQKFKVSWVSKASADQRAGRSGRTGPGHCYRLYSSAVYERDFAQFSVPEISRMPIEGLVLQMKAMGIHQIVNFPFPSSPPRESLSRGLKLLQYLGALDSDEIITDLGKQMSLFPLNPRHAKMLLIGNQHECLGYVVALVSAFSVGDPFVPQHEAIPKPGEDEMTVELKERYEQTKQKYGRSRGRLASLDPKSDAIKILSAVAGYDFAGSKSEYCKENFLRTKVMEEAVKLRQQLAHLVAVNTRPDAVQTTVNKLSAKLSVPNRVQLSALKQIITAGYIDLLAVRADLLDDNVPKGKKNSIVHMPYMPLIPATERYVYIHPDSVLSSSGSVPEFLVYHALTIGDNNTAKLRMRPLVDTTTAVLSRIAAQTPLVTYSKPLGGAYAPKMLSPTKREAWVVPRMGAAIGTGGVGWDLPARKVTQVKRGTDWKTIN